MTDQGISPEPVQNEEAAKPVKKKQKTGRSPEVLDSITDVYRHYDKDVEWFNELLDAAVSGPE
jgi:hypothetical protein